MKRFKLILLLIIAGFIGLFVYQNLAVFAHPFEVLRLNIGVKQYKVENIQASIFFLVFFLLGFLLAFFLGLRERLKARRALKANDNKIKKMEEELNTLRDLSAASESTAVEDVAPEDVVPERNTSEEII